MHLNLFNYAEMLALAVSIIYFKRIKGTPFAILLPYMLMIVCVELTGKYLAEKKLYFQNLHLFNISTVLEFIIFYYLFYNNLNSLRLRNIVKFSIPVYALLAITNQAFIQGFDHFHTHTMLIGSILLITFVFFYFYEALSIMEPVHLFKEPMFWIALGLFLFYLGDFSYNVVFAYIIKTRMQKEGMQLFRLINNNLIIFEYICISIAIITCRKVRPGSKSLSLHSL